MLELKNIKKTYSDGSRSVTALSGISLNFRKSEFVCVLGPSGCGKTTLLNIIGGLDKYSGGSFNIDGVSADGFRESDWDAYRNKRVGFVFQSYNLIAHQTALENVELALTLSGETGLQRKRKAMFALEKVGLSEHLHKKPSELSGGEMQRVAIARAIVNEPDIILADEPTGALDGKNGTQIMDILKEISKTRLVIAVTHNDALAAAYATRTIRLSEGKVVSDSNPYSGEKSSDKNKKSAYKPVNGTLAQKSDKNGGVKKQKNDERKTKRDGKKAKTSMRFSVALGLSFKNLTTKKVRTSLTAFACSVGIVGLALVLALFNGLNTFLDKTQNDALSAYPLTVKTSTTADYESYISIITDSSNYQSSGGKSDNKIFVNHLITKLASATIKNEITPEFASYAAAAESKLSDSVRKVTFDYGTKMNIYKSVAKFDLTELKKNNTKVQAFGLDEINVSYPKVDAGQYFKELPGDEEFVLSQYDLIAGDYPQKANELCLVLDKNNGISDMMLVAFLLDLNATEKNSDGEYIINEYDCKTFLGTSSYTTFALGLNDGLYVKNEEDVYEKQTQSLKNQLINKYGAIPAQEIYNYVSALGFGNVECYNGKEEDTLTLKIVGILRLNDKSTTGCMGIYPIGYTSALSEYYNDNCKNSKVVQAQLDEQKNPQGGNEEKPYRNVLKKDGYLSEAELKSSLKTLGYAETPVAVYFYASDFEGKSAIKKYIAEYNENKADEQKIYATDLVGTVFDVLQTFVDTITTILLALTAISLFVAAIMIAVITYVSVLERTREIGILRAIGARKVDVLGVFNAETIIIGAFSGVLGIIIALILQLPFNSILQRYTGFVGLVALSPLHAIILICVSIVITLISGFIPSLMASKKNPVKALRSDD